MSMNTAALTETISQSITAVERAVLFGNLAMLAIVGLFLFGFWRAAQRRREERLAKENARVAEQLHGLIERVEARLDRLEQAVETGRHASEIESGGAPQARRVK